MERQGLLSDEHCAAGTNDGFACEELAECLLALRRGEEARQWFAKAYLVLSQDPWLAEKEPARIQRLAELSRNAT